MEPGGDRFPQVGMTRRKLVNAKNLPIGMTEAVLAEEVEDEETTQTWRRRQGMMGSWNKEEEEDDDVSEGEEVSSRCRNRCRPECLGMRRK